MQTLRCTACNARVTLAPHEFKCPKCEHKLRESPEEAQRAVLLAQTAHTVRRARLWLLVAAALALLGALWLYGAVAQHWAWLPFRARLAIYLGAGVAVGLLGLWALAARYPVPATALALGIYGGTSLLALIADPSSVLTGILGWLFRALVLVSLATGAAAAWKHRGLRAVAES
jgi:hypothetical protein